MTCTDIYTFSKVCSFLQAAEEMSLHYIKKKNPILDFLLSTYEPRNYISESQVGTS